MDPYLIILAIGSLGGLILPLFLTFSLTFTGSVGRDGWSAGGGIGPMRLLLLPNRCIELQLFQRKILGCTIPDDEGEPEKRGIGILHSQDGFSFPLRAIMRLPIRIDSVTLGGSFYCADAGETGKIYGWITALREALSGTRLHLAIIPDFTGSTCSIWIVTRVKIRSLFHLMYGLMPIVRHL